MIRSRRRGLLLPGEMFPAGEPDYRISFLRLRSGLKVRIVEIGEPGAPVVLFVHGWGCSAYTFRNNLRPVAENGFRAIAVELKGHGLSDKPTELAGYTIDALVAHLLEIVDALGVERAHFVGHSMGGSLIFHFAQAHPERVLSLGLLSAAGLTGVPLMWLYRLLTPRWITPFLRYFKWRLPIKVALRRVYGKRGEYSARDVEEYLAPAQFPDYAPAMRALLHAYDWRAARHRRLAPINIAAAGLWGSLDHMMPEGAMGIYERLVPGIALRRIEDAGHIIPEETPADVNEALKVLLARSSGNSGYISNG